MDFELTAEQRLIVETVRDFVEQELYPHEDEVERLDEVPDELARSIRGKAIASGLYAANMPAELGGGGLDPLSVVLVERELGRASYALQMLVERPSNILQACEGEQRERYLLPAIRGERHDCVAMTEPGAGSDVRVDDHHGGARRRRLRGQRQQALHQPRGRGRLRHPVRRHRRGADRAGAEEADHHAAGGQGTRPAWRSAAARAACPTAATTSASWSSPAAGYPRPTGWARKAAVSSSWASGSARPG